LDKFRVIIFLMLIFLLGCSKHKFIRDIESEETIDKCIKLGGDKKFCYSKRNFYNKKAFSILIKQKKDSLARERLFEIGWNYFNMNELNNFKKISNIIYKSSASENNIYHLGKSLRFFGLYYERNSINDSAFYYYNKAGKLFGKIKNYPELSNNYLDKALVQQYINDFQGSDKSLVLALKYSRLSNLKFQEYKIYLNLGINSYELGDPKKAIEYSKKALNFFNDNNLHNNSDYGISCIGNIGINYSSSGNYKEAILWLEKSLKEKDIDIKSPILYCFILDHLGYAKFKMGNFSNVEKLYKKSARIRDSLRIDDGKQFNRRLFSEYYQATNQKTKALIFAKESYNFSKSFRNAGDILLSLKQLTKVDTQNALKYSQEYIRISDSMQLLERVTRNKFAKIAYETEEITNEKEQAVKQKWIFLSIAVLLLLVGVLLFIIIHQRTKQKEMRLLQDQQKANEEIYQLIQNKQTQIDEGRQIEKKRIAQDLHDGIMNRLASTRLNLHVIAEKPSLENMKKCLPFIDGIQDIEKEIRNIAHDLNSNAFADKTSFIAVVESFVEEQKSISSSKYHLEIDMSINWEQIEGYKKIHLFRILQEAIQNIEKHAKAKNVIVSILKTENQLLLEIFDDGNGFSLKRKKKGIGLQNIFSRAKCCNGKAEVKSKENEGTTVIVRIPI